MVSYNITKENQLSVSLPHKDKKLLHGEFTIDSNNTLIYSINEPTGWYRQYNIPGKIKFDGEWKLDDDHNLVLSVREKENSVEKNLKLRGKIIDSSEDLFLFSIKSNTSPQESRITFLKLRGMWKADKYNRIFFEVKRNKQNRLLLKGIWKLNENNQITYEYEKLKTKRKEKFILSGHWNIISKDRIRYIIERAKDSYLNFKVYLETPNVYPAEGKIKYRVGIGIEKDRKDEVISISGTWKFSRRLGLVFELDSEQGQLHRIKFKAKLTVAKKDKLIFSLYNNKDYPNGISITFLKHHPQIPNKDFQYFLRLKKQGKEPKIEIGGKIRF